MGRTSEHAEEKDETEVGDFMPPQNLVPFFPTRQQQTVRKADTEVILGPERDGSIFTNRTLQ